MTLKIDLWIWTLDVDAAAREALARGLSQDERGRAARFVFARDRDRYVAGRGRLRQILAEQCGTSAGAIRFRYGVHGKPEMADGPSFNLSHSGGWAALAISPGRAVDLGVDIEAHRPVDDGLAERFFSPAEQAALLAMPPEDRTAGFFRCWTRKEALLKASGSGLSFPLDGFDVTLAAGEPARITRIGEGSASDWSLADLALGPGMSGALAVRSAETVEIVLRSGTMPLPTDGSGVSG